MCVSTITILSAAIRPILTHISTIFKLCFGEQTNYVTVKNIMIDYDSLVTMMMDDAFWETCRIETTVINRCFVCLNFIDKCIIMMYLTQDFISEIRF